MTDPKDDPDGLPEVELPQTEGVKNDPVPEQEPDPTTPDPETEGGAA